MSPINSTPFDLTATQPTSQTAQSTTNSPDQLASESTFLKLLVAQIKNQDPSSPTDPTQFVGQLTQYSELEQLIQINTGIKGMDSASANPASSATNPLTQN